jgi:hypothetical protein
VNPNLLIHGEGLLYGQRREVLSQGIMMINLAFIQGQWDKFLAIGYGQGS